MSRDRPIGLGVVGFGWMGRVHATSYRRLAEHFPELGVRPRLIIAADGNPERRHQAARLGFDATTDDWRAVVAHPDVEAISVTVPNHMHRDVAVAAIEAGKHVRVEKPVGRGVDDTEAVASAARRHGVMTTVGFCYRLAPAIQHARALIRSGTIGEVTHYRGTFLADYANRPDAGASWRFLRTHAGSGVLGDLLAHVVDTAHYLVEPIDRVTGRAATMIARRPRLRVGEGTHFSRLVTDDLVDVENEDWAGALFQFAGGTHGSLEASRVIAGPRVGMSVEVYGSLGALRWDLERMNELQRAQLSDDGDEGYTTILVGPEHPDFGAFQPGAGIAMGYDDLRVIEARTFLSSVLDGVQRQPGVDEMLDCAHVLDAIERSSASGAWESTGIAAQPELVTARVP